MRSADFELAHVAQIENPCRGSDREVFGDDPSVAEGHLKTTENCHAGTEFLVENEQRGALGRVHVQLILTNRKNLNDTNREQMPTIAGRYPQRLAPLSSVL